MTARTKEVVRLCEQLPGAAQAEVADFARHLLARQDAEHADGTFQKWLSAAKGAATAGLTTDQVMRMTRGEA